MNTPPENDFAELRRLLRIKRHEQPPPGYFDNFPRTVLAVLRSDRKGGARTNEPENVPLWIARLVARFQSQPAFAGMVGAGICALAIGGVVLYLKDTKTPPTMPSLLSEITPETSPAAIMEPSDSPFQPVTPDTTLPLIASNNLQFAPGTSLFDTIPPIDTAPVGVRPPDRIPVGTGSR
jgi:hypothetical protein